MTKEKEEKALFFGARQDALEIKDGWGDCYRSKQIANPMYVENRHKKFWSDFQCGDYNVR